MYLNIKLTYYKNCHYIFFLDEAKFYEVKELQKYCAICIQYLKLFYDKVY